LPGAALHFTLVFPRPWPELQRRPLWLLVLYLGAWLPWMILVLAFWWQPGYGAIERMGLVVRGSSTMSVVVFPLAVVTSFVSYRRIRSDAERRQLRWVLWAMLVSILPWVPLVALPQALSLTPLLPPFAVGVLWVTLPTAFAISILREGLFDIDVIINRSLVYGGLTVVLAIAYFGTVIILQSLLRTLTGQQQSQLATVLSTLTIAGLFSPLRQLLQRDVDRRFYRRKYDAARTLAAFGATMRDDVDLDVLTGRLLGVVDETMRPAQTWLWLRPARRRPADSIETAGARSGP
jgi:hypothetical protein